VGALLASGCGVTGDEATAGDELTDGELVAADPDIFRLRAPEDPGEGCDPLFAETSPLDLAADRRVARCAPDHPVAQPLDEPVELRVALQEPNEELAPLLLADMLGEFEDENISIELVEVSDLVEAYRLLGEGEVDAVVGDYHAKLFDQIVGGDGARVVMGGAVSAAAGYDGVPQAGLWMAHDALEKPGRWIDLEHEPILVPGGIRGVTSYPLNQTFVQGEATLNDMRVVQEGGASAAELLAEGGVKAAWLDDPHWQTVADRDELTLVVTRPREALGGVTLGEELVDPEADRDVGVAFVRALIRTINTHLSDPDVYRSDEEIVDALVELTGWTDEQFAQVPGYVFDWELRNETLERIQGPLVGLGAVTYPTTLHDEEFADTSLYLEAVRE
jgi:hypothetical protein